ncbi:MAG: hypothetical protein IKC59_02040 [Clostridia bacterium]|nr:hypothetical protein [Clostridia bacterium]
MKHYKIDSNLSEKQIRRLISLSEGGFSSQLESLCDRLLLQEELHFLGLTGPTCSGKTTAAELLTDAFEADGKRVHVISIDDFFYEKNELLELSREKGLKRLDYDSEDTIDMPFLHACVESLRNGKKTQLPKFNFVSGAREIGKTITPSAKDVFLFEGIQVLYPQVDLALRTDAYQSIHIAPQSSIEIGGECFFPNEIRLMRRLVRDYRFRNALPEFTLMLWQSVRENEERLIFPNIHRCDFSIDSTMPYEIGILKPFLDEILSKMPLENDFLPKAKEIVKRLARVQSLSAELIAEKSLYKEFV